MQLAFLIIRIGKRNLTITMDKLCVIGSILFERNFDVVPSIGVIIGYNV